eukprot:COSAG05_NODE_354_length_10862_cov_59.954659_12_plen_104_part_00
MLNLVGGAEELTFPTRRRDNGVPHAGGAEDPAEPPPQENRERVKTFRSRGNMYEPRARQFVEVEASLGGGELVAADGSSSRVRRRSHGGARSGSAVRPPLPFA